MTEIITLSQALCFEYYMGAIEQTSTSFSKKEALEFYTQHKEEYLDKAEKILDLLSKPPKVLH